MPGDRSRLEGPLTTWRRHSCPMPHSFASCAKGGPRGPPGTPSSRLPGEESGSCHREKTDQGVGRAQRAPRGRPPHHLCRCPEVDGSTSVSELLMSPRSAGGQFDVPHSASFGRGSVSAHFVSEPVRLATFTAPGIPSLPGIHRPALLPAVSCQNGDFRT